MTSPLDTAFERAGRVELEATAAAGCAAEAIPIVASQAGESVPFLVPRSSDAARRAQPQAQPRPLFYRDKKTAATVSSSAIALHEGGTEPALADSVDATVISDSAPMSTSNSPDLSAMYQAEEDKTYLQSALEELYTCEIPTSASAPTLGFCSYLLARYFNLSSGTFRPHQQEVCLSILQGRHTLAVCPTGWGKSLCYQFPMLVHRLLFLARRQAWRTRWVAPTGVSAAASKDGSSTSVRGGGPNPNTTSQPQPLPEGIYSKFCIVVSPLLSLIADQMDKIRDTGCLKAITISSQVAPDREAELLQSLASPVSEVDILFTSPEKFMGSVHVRELLRRQSHRVAMVCVDEVHCVSRWAYDFRPSFMYISRVLADAAGPKIEVSRRVPFLCLTATATSAVVREVEAEYRIERTVVASDQHRHSLQLTSVDLVARQRQQQKPPQRAGAASTTLSSPAQPPTHRVLQDALLEAVVQMPKPMIVYVQSRCEADELSSFIASKLGGGSGLRATGEVDQQSTHTREGGVGNGPSVFNSASMRASFCCGARDKDDPGRALVVRCYHAALSRQLRTATQRQFIEDRIDVLVATVAFGMGIDKPNIRSVVHAYAPSSLESYVQEIGRAGRDGERSVCRVLYNPFEYYSLRCRVLTALVSPAEVNDIVRCIFRSPSTLRGDRLTLVCPCKIAEELAIAEETVETVLFMIVTARHQPLTAHLQTATKSLPIFASVRGCCALGFRVNSVHTEGVDGNETDEDARARRRRQQQQSRKRPRLGGASARYADGMFATASGVSSLLARLSARDAVLDVFRGRSIVENQITVVNEANMSWDDFQFRLDDLLSAGILQLSRLSSSSTFLLELGPGYVDAACPSGQKELSQLLFDAYRTRLDSQMAALRTMFEVLAHPTHEAIHEALRGMDECSVAVPSASWTPPPRTLTKMEAVSIANDFVAKNGIRLQSTYEAARCLLGIMPKSLIKHGKYAGQIPLALSWYVSSPYFGSLREFDLDWVLAVLKPHNLDCAKQ